MIFDTHIHLNDTKILENLDFYIKDAIKNGVNRFLCVGFDIPSSKIAIEIANKYKEVYASIGVIPTEHKQYELENKKTYNELKELYKTSSKIVAIGEIGLDYYWEKEDSIKEKQKKMFIEQIELANELDLPVSIHARNSLQDTFDILKNFPVKQKGIMHCYSGSMELAKEFIKIGYKIAFGGVLTFKNSKESKETIKNIDLKDVVFETDAPYLAPTPYRGKLNEPKFIKNTVEFASELLNIECKELERITYENSCKILHVENNEKVKIDDLIVVEGKTDIDFLSSFIDGDFYSVNGSAVSMTDIEYLKNVQKQKDIVVLTDPDFPGMKIRNFLNRNIENLKNAYVRKEFSIKHHKVGVAESEKEEILRALKKSILYKRDVKTTITISDLLNLGLTGSETSAKKRYFISSKLSLGKSNTKSFLKKINLLGITFEELKEINDAYSE